MVSKLPSIRCLSKASREGDLSENMANADISASVKGISTSSPRASVMLQSCFEPNGRGHRQTDACVLSVPRWTLHPPDMRSSNRSIVSFRGILSHPCLRKARGEIGVVTGFGRPPGIAVNCCFNSTLNLLYLSAQLARWYAHSALRAD